MDALMVVVAEFQRFGRILLLHEYLDVYGSVNDVLHWRLRDSRTASRVTSWTPRSRTFLSRKRSIRAAAALRCSMVGRIPLAMRSHSACISPFSAGFIPLFSTLVFMVELLRKF